MRKKKSIFLGVWILFCLFISQPLKAQEPLIIVVTVDGLEFDFLWKDLLLEEDPSDEELKLSMENPYLGPNILSMIDNFVNETDRGTIQVINFPWDRNPTDGNTTNAVNELRAFLNDVYLKYVSGTNNKFVIISHSWGTFLAYHALKLGPIATTEFPNVSDLRIDLFITLGSPLGTRETITSFFLGPENLVVEGYVAIKEIHLNNYINLNPSLKPQNKSVISNWINYWSWGDIISAPISTYGESLTPNYTNIELGCWDPRYEKLYRGIASTFPMHYYDSLGDIAQSSYSYYCDYSELVGRSVINNILEQLLNLEPPIGTITLLNTPSVSPSIGEKGDLFIYRVTYSDTSALQPVEQKIYIDGVAYDMTLESVTSDNRGFTGTYKFEKGDLSYGPHNYRFSFQTGYRQFLFGPASGTYFGPVVNTNTITNASITTAPVAGDIFVDGEYKGNGSWTGLLSAGIHKASFSEVGGSYANPMKFAVSYDQVAEVTGIYHQMTPGVHYITNSIMPDGAIAVGAQWRIDGGPWRYDGYTESVSAGNHILESKEIPGWIEPSSFTFQIEPNLMWTGWVLLYHNKTKLKVNILPKEVTSQGAKWRVDDGPWRESGYEEQYGEQSCGVDGEHTITFKDVGCWITPPEEKINIKWNQNLATSIINSTYLRSCYPLWKMESSTAPWSARENHSTVVHDGKMWIIGGKRNVDLYRGDWNNEDLGLNDVWSSNDGISWIQATASAPWSPRFGHMSLVYNGKIWVIGGETEKLTSTSGPPFGWQSTLYRFKDIWCSEDGVNWTQINASMPFIPQLVIIFKNEIFAFGGANTTSGWKNIWHSSDGINWTGAYDALLPYHRYNTSLIAFDGRLWLFGGYSGGYYNDVWCSNDGTNWEKIADSTPWSARQKHESVVIDDKIWIIGGSDALGDLNDVWSSTDGINWTQTEGVLGWSARSGNSSIVYNNRIWVIGGAGSSDIWASPAIISIVTDTKIINVPEGGIASFKVKLSGKPSNDIVLSITGSSNDNGILMKLESSVTFTADNWDTYQTISLEAIQDNNYENEQVVFTLGSSGVSDKKIIAIVSDDDQKNLSWKNITRSALGSGRALHTSVVFNGKIWLIGGQYSDVWSSANGLDWQLVTNSAPWGKRSGHTSVVFNNKIWVIGGFVDGSAMTSSDVWCSGDGQNWTQVTTSVPWGLRANHSSVVFDNKIWILGGLIDSSPDVTKSDVWYSEDGAIWIKAVESAPWPTRSYHTSVVFDNKIWVNGGFSDDGGQSSLSDAWYSSNGIDWIKSTDSASWGKRMGHTSVVYDNKIWIIGGLYYDSSSSSFTTLSDTWFTGDGIGWSQFSDTNSYESRALHSSAVFNGLIWIIGGTSDIEHMVFNDVWNFGYSYLRILSGDINDDSEISLKDLISALRISAGIKITTEQIFYHADVNGDGKIGLAEVIYIMQKVAGMR